LREQIIKALDVDWPYNLCMEHMQSTSGRSIPIYIQAIRGRLGQVVGEGGFFVWRGRERVCPGLQPILDLGLRLGEGNGAALAMGVIEGATRIIKEVLTFEEASVSSSSRH